MKTSLLVSALSFALLAGCGGAANQTPDAGTGLGDSGTEDSTDAGTPDAGSEDPGPPCEGPTAPCAIHWTDSAAYPTRVDHHTAFAHTSAAGTFVYVAGGVTSTNDSVSDVYPSVRRAKVHDDGSLSAWEDLAALPIPIAFHAMTIANDRVYLVAGITKDNGTVYTNRDTLIGDFDADGKLTWRMGKPLPEAFLHPSAQVLGQRLYLVGGSGGMMDPKDKVYISELDDTGMTGAWSAAPKLPVPRSHHVTVTRDGHLYAIGGFTTGQIPLEEVLRSTNDETGAITGWELAGLMDNPPWTAAGFIHGDWVYLIGGGEGGPGEEQYVDHIRRGRFDEHGLLLSGFEDVDNPLPRGRAHVHHIPVVNGRLYSIGGRVTPSFSSIDEVFVGKMDAL